MQQPIDYNRAHVSPALPVTAKGHPAAMWYLSLARMCERFGYYGMRSVFLLYLTNTVGVDKMHASTIYGTLTTTMYITPVIGGLLGDFVISRKYMMIIGAFIEIIGILLMFIPHPAAVALGGGIIAIGSGFYAPNILAALGESYRGREHLSDAGFMVIYGFINVGAFLAPVICGFMFDSFGYLFAFLVAAIGMGIGQIFLFLYKPSVVGLKEIVPARAIHPWIIIPVLIAVILFWILFSVLDDSFYTMSQHARITFSYSWLLSTEAISIILFTVVFSIVWTFVRLDSLIKIAAGFLLIAITIYFTSIFIVPQEVTINAGIPVTLMCIQGLSEALVVPILFSVFAQHTAKTYMGTIMSLLVGVPWVTNYLFVRLNDYIKEHSPDSFFLFFISVALIAAALFLILHFVLKPKRTEPVYTS